MQFKILSKVLLSIVIVSGVFFSPIVSGQVVMSVGPSQVTVQDTPGLPVILTIPTINVNAKVDYVGLTPKGAVGVPVGPSTVAWFNLGPRPGSIGNAIIDGHFGTWKDGSGSVFDNLNKLKIGDKIYVIDEKGLYVTFIVQKIKMYSLNESASEVFISSDNLAHLNLITCAGTWSGVKKTYSNRLVVFTTKEQL